MKKLHLKTSRIIQGDFAPEKTNLLLIFQVNCPGCFVYALPLAARLHGAYRDRQVKILALSTAFEDFALNTVANTQRLVEAGELVGMTQLFFQSQGISKFPLPLDFPIAFDRIGAGQEIFTDADIDLFCMPSAEPDRPNARLPDGPRPYLKQLLQSQTISSYTFTLNQLQGTPSWVLFDERFSILAQWFGHKSEAEVTQIIDRALESPREA